MSDRCTAPHCTALNPGESGSFEGEPQETIDKYIGTSPWQWVGDKTSLGLGTAMYDLMGKDAGCPVWQLFGQQARTCPIVGAAGHSHMEHGGVACHDTAMARPGSAIHPGWCLDRLVRPSAHGRGSRALCCTRCEATSAVQAVCLHRSLFPPDVFNKESISST